MAIPFKNEGRKKNGAFREILLFSITLAATGVLQLLYNTADTVIVGKFSGSIALAAVGATSALITILVNMSMGIAAGVNVVVARHVGAQDREGVTNSIHTAIPFGILWGCAIFLVGVFFCEPMLRLTDTPEDVLPLSALYMRIYFCGVPMLLLYNFCAAILRAHGDTQHSLVYLSISGAVNVLLNLLFVTIFHMGVAGVALATTLSNFLSLFLILRYLVAQKMLRLSGLHIYPAYIKEIIHVGLPACLQSFFFGIANITIQGSVNTFGAAVMAANTASASISAFVYQPMNAVYHASLTYIGNASGAGDVSRIRRISRECLATVLLIGVPLSVLFHLAGRPLLSLYVAATDPHYPEILAFGMVRSLYITLPYFFCGIMECYCGCVRGLGHSWTAMAITILGACVFRLGWILTLFRYHHTLPVLYLSFPVSWIISAIAYILCFLYLIRRFHHQKIGVYEHE